MNSRFSTAMFVVFLSTLTVPCLAGGEADRAEEAFRAYKSAAMNDRGSEAAELLSGSTVAYYEKLRELALYATAEELDTQSTINLMQVLLIRHRVPVQRLQAMEGRSLLRHALDQGWVGKNGMASVEVDEVFVDGNTAVVDVFSARDPNLDLSIQLVKEEGDWKIDLAPLIQAAGAQLDMLIRQNDFSREEFVLMMLTNVSGSQASDSIWTPPLERPQPPTRGEVDP